MSRPSSPRSPWRLPLALAGSAVVALFALRVATPHAAVAAEPGAHPSLPMGVHTRPDSSRITFARDVAPIIQQHCQLCHSPGGIGPMPLLTYSNVRRYGPLIKQLVQAREMPPYQYDTHVGIQQLQHDWRLSEQDIATVVQWVEDGMPQGDPADMPPNPPLPAAGEYRLAASYGPPDLVIKSAKYTVPANGQDRWWRPSVPSGITVDRCIKAVETKPSAAGRSVTHHANSIFVPASSTRGPDAVGGGGPGSVRLSEYALGKIAEVVPADACRIAPAESNVLFDIHYFPNGKEIVDDQLEIGIWFHGPEVTPTTHHRQSLGLYALQSGSGDFEIEPHGTLITQGFHRFDTPVRIDSWQPHGHLRLVAKRLEVLYPDGRRETLSMVSNWHPGWHHSHVYDEAVAPLLPAGSVLINTAWYDNTAKNPHNPDPDQWVGVGDRTTDEMSHAWIAVTTLDEAAYQRLRAQRTKQ
jgi:hypothetical protein